MQQGRQSIGSITPMIDTASKKTFFIQGSWMLTATMASGILMFAVHFFGGWMKASEYGLFVTLLQVLNLAMIPALGLQTVFAQQTALAKTPSELANLSISIRKVFLICIGIWSFTAHLLLLLHTPILRILKINNSIPIYLTIAIGLPQLCLPILLGILQGQQNFCWLGGTAITNGLIRFLTVGILVAGLGMQANGAISGVLIGLVAAFTLATWHGRNAWTKDNSLKGQFQPSYWLRRIVPLTLGLGAGQFMLSADMIAARITLPDNDSGIYGAAGMIGRGLVIFTAPLAAVMLPKIIRSKDHEEQNILNHTFSRTAILSIIFCSGCTLAAWIIPSITESVPILSLKQKNITNITSLVPYFVWSMLPLALANVYVVALLAKEQYKGIPMLILVATTYALTLIWLTNNPNIANNVTIIFTLGLFNLCYLGLSRYLIIMRYNNTTSQSTNP